MRNFMGRVAVVTGAASGIGRATSVELARQGCDLALVDVHEPGMQETAALVRAQGRKVSVHLADVSDKLRMQELPQEVLHEHGHIHIVVNNAGVLVYDTLEKQSLDDFEWIVGINFWGVVYGCKFFLPSLKCEDEGHLVNLCSAGSFIGAPLGAAYCATKAAVRAVSETLQAELAGTHIGVTCVHPGTIRTNLVHAGRTSDVVRKQRAARNPKRYGMPPERAARKIVHAMARNQPRVRLGLDAYLIDWATRLFPVLTNRLVSRLVAWRYQWRSRHRSG